MRLCAPAALLVACTISAAAQQPAREATLGFPIGIAQLADGTFLISERRNHRVMRLDADAGTLTPFAGTGEAGFSGDGGPARQAQLQCPDAVDADSRGNVYIADRCNERIRRVDAATGVITTVAGSGLRGPGPDGPALDVNLMGVFYLRVHDDNTILFTDTDAHRIRELDLRRGTITTLAGNGYRGFSGDGGPARDATLARPHVVLRLRNGNLVIGDSFNRRIREVSARDGTIRTIAGVGDALGERPAQHGALALESPLLFFGEIHELDDGDLLWTEWGSSQIVRLDRTTGRLRVVAGSTAFGRHDPDGALSDNPAIGAMVDFVIDEQGRYVVTVSGEGLVRRIDVARGTVETLAGRP